MSSASIPVPRTPPPGSTPRRTFFWPMFVLIAALGTQAFYQVMALEDQLDEVTRAVDKLDPKVKAAQHDKTLFFALARDVLNLAPKDPNAEQIVVDFKIRQLKAYLPTLFELAPPTPSPADTQTNTITNPMTNTAPTELPNLPSTNAAVPGK
jgi:hypothetical protein